MNDKKSLLEELKHLEYKRDYGSAPGHPVIHRGLQNDHYDRLNRDIHRLKEKIKELEKGSN